jgi:hypothetical protein
MIRQRQTGNEDAWAIVVVEACSRCFIDYVNAELEMYK